jgi:hypothetical protein
MGIAGKVQANERDKLKLANGGKFELCLDAKPRKSIFYTFWLKFKYSIVFFSPILTVLHLFPAKN